MSTATLHANGSGPSEATSPSGSPAPATSAAEAVQSIYRDILSRPTAKKRLLAKLVSDPCFVSGHHRWCVLRSDAVPPVASTDHPTTYTNASANISRLRTVLDQSRHRCLRHRPRIRGSTVKRAHANARTFTSKCSVSLRPKTTTATAATYRAATAPRPANTCTLCPSLRLVLPSIDGNVAGPSGQIHHHKAMP